MSNSIRKVKVIRRIGANHCTNMITRVDKNSRNRSVDIEFLQKISLTQCLKMSAHHHQGVSKQVGAFPFVDVKSIRIFR